MNVPLPLLRNSEQSPQVSDEEVLVSVVVVVACAYSLTPAGAGQTGSRGYIRERSVAVVLVGGDRSGPAGRIGRFEPRAVDEEDIEPTVVIEVEKRRAATRGLQKIFVLLLPTEDRFLIQSCLAGDINELDSRWQAARESVRR